MNKEPIYYFQPEKGIVVCELSNCELDAITFMSKRFPPLNFLAPHLDDEDLEEMPDNFFMNESYKGVAVTVAGDTYDEEFGKKLAYSIAIKKYNIALHKKVKNIATSYRKYAAEMDGLLNKAISLADKRELGSLDSLKNLLDKDKEDEAAKEDTKSC